MTRWLIGVVEDADGTGKRARSDGWRVAGKTGTAQKADPVTGGYSADRHFSSFVGFAPAESPRVVIGVFIDEPKGETYGGEVAAPPFREIAEYALKMLGVPPDGRIRGAAAPAPAPPAVAQRRATAPPSSTPPAPHADARGRAGRTARRSRSPPAGSPAPPAAWPSRRWAASRPAPPSGRSRPSTSAPT